MEAKSQAGPAVGDVITWRNQNNKPGRNKTSTGKVVGFQGDDLLVEYVLNLGRGAVKTKTVSVKRERLIDSR